MTLGLKDRIFQDSRPLGSGSEMRQEPKKSGYPNIFSHRSIDHGGLTSPKGSMIRQENYLAKITSEKRNMLSMKKFANSGMGPSRKHPYFVRKIDWNICFKYHLLYLCLLKLKCSWSNPLSKMDLNPCFSDMSHSLLMILKATSSYGGPALNFMMTVSKHPSFVFSK